VRLAPKRYATYVTEESRFREECVDSAGYSSIRVVRGRTHSLRPHARNTSIPRGNNRVFRAHWERNVSPRPLAPSLFADRDGAGHDQRPGTLARAGKFLRLLSINIRARAIEISGSIAIPEAEPEGTRMHLERCGTRSLRGRSSALA